MKSFICILLMTVGIFLNGYVTQTMWEWFVVTQFHVLPLGLAAAIGLRYMVQYVVHGFREPKELTEEEEIDPVGRNIARRIVYPLAVLGVAWVIKCFM